MAAQRSVTLWSTIAPKSPPLNLAVRFDGSPAHLVEVVCEAVALRFHVACTSSTHTLRLWDEECRGFSALSNSTTIPESGPIKAALAPLHPKPPASDASGAMDTPPLPARPNVAKRRRLDDAPRPSPLTAAAPKHAAKDAPCNNNNCELVAADGQVGTPRGSMSLPSTASASPATSAAAADACRASSIAAVGLASGAFWKTNAKEDLNEFPLKTMDVPRPSAPRSSNVVLGELIGLL